MKFAVHLHDLVGMSDANPLMMILRPFLIQETVQLVAGEALELGVLVNDELPGHDWYAALDMALIGFMPDESHVIRIYKTDKGGWTKVKRGEFAPREEASV